MCIFVVYIKSPFFNHTGRINDDYKDQDSVLQLLSLLLFNTEICHTKEYVLACYFTVSFLLFSNTVFVTFFIRVSIDPYLVCLVF